MKLSMWTNYYHELSKEEAISRIAGAGFGYTELADIRRFIVLDSPEVELDKFKAHAEREGVKLHQLHGYWGELLVDGSPEWNLRIEIFKKEITCSARLGIKVIVAHPMNLTDEKGYPSPGTSWNQRKASLERNVSFFKALAGTLEETGVSVGIENMPYNYLWTYAEELNELVDAIDSPNVGVTLDTSHLNMSRCSFAQFIHKLGKRLIATHISDNLQDADRHLMPMFGHTNQGWIDWFDVRDALREADYQGTFNLEVPGEGVAPLEIRDMKIKYIHDALEWFFNRD